MLALRSAAERGGFERIVLHHDTALDNSPHYPALLRVPGVELRPIEPGHSSVLGRSDRERVRALYARLEQPAARANLLRALILLEQGGVYLDMDTVTVQSFAELLQTPAFFCGVERICFPATLKRSRSPLAHGRAWALSGLRLAMRFQSSGYLWFRKLESWYALAANNAILGAPAGNSFVANWVERMLAIPEAQSLVRYALGTHLLQDCLAGTDAETARVLPPAYFYPLPPEIADHWFRLRREPELDAVLAPETLVVHWYASNRHRRLTDRIDPVYVRQHQDRQLFSALAARYLEPSEGLK